MTYSYYYGYGEIHLRPLLPADIFKIRDILRDTKNLDVPVLPARLFGSVFIGVSVHGNNISGVHVDLLLDNDVSQRDFEGLLTFIAPHVAEGELVCSSDDENGYYRFVFRNGLWHREVGHLEYDHNRAQQVRDSVLESLWESGERLRIHSHEDLLTWFDENHSKGLSYLIYGDSFTKEGA